MARDVPRPSYLLGRQFPEVVDQLTHQDLVALALAYGQGVDTEVSRSNALSWECLYERMGYILCFFRAFQRDARYFRVPAQFTGGS